MSLIGSLFGHAEARSLNGQVPDPTSNAVVDVGPLPGMGGGAVIGSRRNPLALPAAFAAVRVISETIGTLPLMTYRKTASGRERLGDEADPRVAMLHDQPNPDETSVEFWENVVGIMLLRGRCLVRVSRDFYARPVQLDRMDPTTPCRIVRDSDGTRFWQLPAGPNGQPQLLDIGDVIPYTAWMGLSPFTTARLAHELGLTAQEYGAKLWDNSARPGSYLATDGELNDTQWNRMVEQWQERHQGVGNAGRLGVLEGGVKWVDVGFKPDDAQFLETRKFQVTEIARMVRLPAHKIGDLERATFSNIEHQSIEYVQDAILPWSVRLERRTNSGVWDNKRDRGVFSEFLLDGLLRGDTVSRFEAYAKAPWMQDNEKRARENLAPLPGLDATYAPLNMARIVDGVVVPPVAPAPTETTLA